jgi:hypothetical protein
MGTSMAEVFSTRWSGDVREAPHHRNRCTDQRTQGVCGDFDRVFLAQ